MPVGRYPPPDPRRELVAIANLRKILGKGMRGDLVYQYRRDFTDSASQDDYIYIEFSTDNVDYQYMTRVVLPTYVESFSAYYAAISDDNFILMDFEEASRLKINLRNSVYRIPPACFLDERLCRGTFNLPPAALAKKLDGKVERVKEVNNGVMITLSSSPLPTPQMDSLCWQAKRDAEARSWLGRWLG